MASVIRLFLMAAFMLVILSAGNSSMAQSFGDAFVGVGDNDEPVNIEAERLEVIDKQKTAVLSGNVKVIQGTTVVRSKEMRIFYFAEAHIFSVSQHRNDKTFTTANRNSDIAIVMVDQVSAIHLSINRRILLQRVNDGTNEE